MFVLKYGYAFKVTFELIKIFRIKVLKKNINSLEINGG